MPTNKGRKDLSDQRNVALPIAVSGPQSRPLPHAEAVVVTGVHRSGTRAVAELLNANGVGGCASDAQIPDLNQRMLRELGAEWWAPPAIDSVDVAADDVIPSARQFWEALAATLGDGPALLQDPLFSLLLPVWRRVLGPAALYVVCVRDPVSISRSLLAHDELELPVGAALWEAYTIACLRGLTGLRAVFVDVDSLAEHPEVRVRLVEEVRAAAALGEEHEFVDTVGPRLLTARSVAQEHEEHLTAAQLLLYRSLERLPQDAVAVGGLQHLRVPSATLRILDRHCRSVRQQNQVTIELEQLERKLDDAKAELTRQCEETSVLQSELQQRHEEIEKMRSELTQLAQVGPDARLDNDLLLAREQATAMQERMANLDEAARRLADELRARRADVDRLSPLESEVVALRVELESGRHEMSARRCEAEERATEVERLQALLLDAQQSLSIERARVADPPTEALANLQAQLVEAHSRVVLAAAETARVHSMYAQAFDSRSWRWTRLLRRDGRGETAHRRNVGVGDAESALPSGPATPRIAVVVHVFYPELWPALALQLSNLHEQPFDLFVSVTRGHADYLVKEILGAFPRAVVRAVENRGRDIAPLFLFLNEGLLEGYSAILKLHTKRSRHRADGDAWRASLLHGLLPSPHAARRFAQLVATREDVGCILPDGNVRRADAIGSNETRVAELLGRLGVPWDLASFEFPSGSMYWLSGSIVQRLGQLRLDLFTDFEEESGQIDGTTAHAVERVLGPLMQQQGRRILSSEEVLSDVEVAGMDASA